MRAAAPWLTVALLGAFHGVNPAMGWLFAVGRGLHSGERRAVFHALPPIALGHFLSIAGVALLAGGAGFLLDVRVVRWVCAGLLMTFGVLLLARKIRHRWFGMQVGFGGLTGWSFLMASAHGAGLMVVPAILSCGVGWGGRGGFGPRAGTRRGRRAHGEPPGRGCCGRPPRVRPPGVEAAEEGVDQPRCPVGGSTHRGRLSRPVLLARRASCRGAFGR